MSGNFGRPGAARHLSQFVLALFGSGLLLAAPASARSLGSLAPPRLGGCTSCSVFQRETAVGEPSYVVPPGNWTITSWAAQGGGTASGKARLQIYRPTHTPGQFKLLKQSHLELVPKNGHPSFTTSLAVKGGDLLGLRTEKNLVSAYNALAGNNVAIVFCEPTDPGHLVGAGTNCPLGNLEGALVNVKVDLIKQ